MPTLVILGAIKIQMFADDHNPPHFHVITPDNEALVLLKDLSVMRGTIRSRDLETVQKWANDRKSELNDLWSNLNAR